MMGFQGTIDFCLEFSLCLKTPFVTEKTTIHEKLKSKQMIATNFYM